MGKVALWTENHKQWISSLTNSSHSKENARWQLTLRMNSILRLPNVPKLKILVVQLVVKNVQILMPNHAAKLK